MRGIRVVGRLRNFGFDSLWVNLELVGEPATEACAGFQLRDAFCPRNAAEFGALLGDANEVIRYWAAQGLLMLKARATPAKADFAVEYDGARRFSQ